MLESIYTEIILLVIVGNIIWDVIKTIYKNTGNKK